MAKTSDHLGIEYESAKKMCMEYGIPVSVFYNRKAKGIMTLEEMLTTPVLKKRSEYINPDTGESYDSQVKLSKELGLSKSGVYARLKNGVSGADLFKDKLPRGQRFDKNYKSFTDPFGVFHKSEKAMCRYYDIDYNLYRKRIKRGISMADAITLGKKRVRRGQYTDPLGVIHEKKGDVYKYYGITRSSYEYRVNVLKMSEKEALTMPKTNTNKL